MAARFLFLVILGLVSNAYCQILSNGIGYNKGLSGFGPNCYGPNTGGYPNGYPVGYGDVAIVGELPVGGSTAVAGQVPVIGYVNFEGYLPAGGLVSVAPNCGCI